METIAANIENVQSRIAQACNRSSRNVNEIKLVAVSKRKPVELILKAYEVGVRDFGENTAQELRDKVKEMGLHDIRWHFIGHLQSNKIKYVAPVAHLVHSVESLKLAQEIDKWLQNKGIEEPIKVLIQIKTAIEESKFGVTPDGFISEMEKWKRLKNLQFSGVMTMATHTREETEIRRCFKEASVFYERLKQGNFFAPGKTWLSMGMTDDFEMAIDEGANMLRIGSAIFGQR